MPGRARSESSGRRSGERAPRRGSRSGEEAPGPTVGAPRPTTAPAEGAVSTGKPVGQSNDEGRNVAWEFVGDDDAERPGTPPPHVAEHPEEVVENVVQGMECEDAEKMRQFLALTKEILMNKCKACEVQVRARICAGRWN